MGHCNPTIVVGIIASMTSIGLIISQVPIICRICNKKTLKDFHPYPYLTCSCSYLFWCLYGLVTMSSIDSEASPAESRLQFVVGLNFIGQIFGFAYMLIFASHSTRKHTIIITVIGLVHFVLYFAVAIMIEHLKGTSIIFGPIAVVFGIITYGSPMSVIRNIYKTSSVGYLPFGLCLVSIMNGVVWFIYAFLPIFDIYLAIANGIGIQLGLVQLILLCMFREKPQVYCIEKLEDVEIL